MNMLNRDFAKNISTIAHAKKIGFLQKLKRNRFFIDTFAMFLLTTGVMFLTSYVYFCVLN